MRRAGLWMLPFAVLLLTEASPAIVQVTADGALGDRGIVPGERIGRLRLAGSLAELTSMLGDDPAKRQAPAGSHGSTLYEWKAASVAVGIDDGTGHLAWIAVTTGPHGWHRARTAQGLGIGTPAETLVATLGKPSQQITESNGATTTYAYDAQGIRFAVAPMPTSDRVVMVRIGWPHTLAGNGLIVPGESIGSVSVRLSLDNIASFLGGGDQSYPLGENRVYVWPHRGVRVLTRGGRVISIGAFSTPILEAIGVSYATADGLAIGASEADVRARLGEPPSRTEQPPLRWALYPSRGLSVAFDGQSRVVLMEVFAAQRTSVPLRDVVVGGIVGVVFAVGYVVIRCRAGLGSRWPSRVMAAAFGGVIVIAVLQVARQMTEVSRMTFWRSPVASNVFVAGLMVFASLVALAFYTRRRQRRFLEPLREILDERFAEPEATSFASGASRLAGHVQGRAVRFVLRDGGEDNPSQFRVGIACHTRVGFDVRRPTGATRFLRRLFHIPGRTGAPEFDENFVLESPRSTDRERLVLWAGRPEVRHVLASLMDDHRVTRVGTCVTTEDFDTGSDFLEAVYRPYRKRDVAVANVRRVLDQLKLLDDLMRSEWYKSGS